MPGLIAALIALAIAAPAASAWTLQDAPIAHASVACADYPNQAAAQRAADTVDADGDGIYCESLPCPCLNPGQGGETKPAEEPESEPDRRASCRRPSRVQLISFSA